MLNRSDEITYENRYKIYLLIVILLSHLKSAIIITLKYI